MSSLLLLHRPEAATTGVLRFNGTRSSLKWGTLATALANVSDGAWTAAFLFRRATVSTGPEFDALGYLLSGTGDGTVEAGLSMTTANLLNIDVGGVGSTLDVPSASESYIAVAGKSAGTVTPRLSRYVKSTNTWTHADASATLADQVAATMLQLGTWQGQFDRFDGWLGVAAFWEGNLSDAHRAALSTNWRTSDWWASAHGTPKFLVQLNVDGASVTDLAGNATGLVETETVLDPNQTLDSWSFDGIGASLNEPIAAGSSATGVVPTVTIGALPPIASSVATGQTPSPTVASTVPVAGTVATGRGPSPTITTALVAGSSVAAGRAPASSTIATAPVAASLTTGVSPSQTVSAMPGIASTIAQGVAPSVPLNVLVTTGGAIATGQAPVPSVIAVPGVASTVATGRTPAAAVTATVPVASSVTQGVAPVPSIAATSSRAGTVTAGAVPSATMTVPLSSASVVTGGVPPSAVPIISPDRGAATAGTNSPTSSTQATPVNASSVATGVVPLATITSSLPIAGVVAGTRTPSVTLIAIPVGGMGTIGAQAPIPTINATLSPVGSITGGTSPSVIDAIAAAVAVGFGITPLSLVLASPLRASAVATGVSPVVFEPYPFNYGGDDDTTVSYDATLGWTYHGDDALVASYNSADDWTYGGDD